MIEKRINTNKVLLYESIDELPITRFKEYNKNLLIDFGLGSTIEDASTHLTSIIRHIDNKDLTNARQQVLNLWQNINLVLSGNNPQANALMCLIYSVNGEIQTDLSAEGLKRLSEKLSKKGLTWGKMVVWLNSIKKKLKSSLRIIFLKSRTRKQRNIS